MLRPERVGDGAAAANPRPTSPYHELCQLEEQLISFTPSPQANAPRVRPSNPALIARAHSLEGVFSSGWRSTNAGWHFRRRQAWLGASRAKVDLALITLDWVREANSPGSDYELALEMAREMSLLDVDDMDRMQSVCPTRARWPANPSDELGQPSSFRADGSG